MRRDKADDEVCVLHIERVKEKCNVHNARNLCGWTALFDDTDFKANSRAAWIFGEGLTFTTLPL